MSLEFIGMIQPREQSEIHPARGPGFQAPTTAARGFATLDQLSGGRAAIHVISGGDDADQARDGDWLGKDARYARTDEYVDVLKWVWTAEAPVDHEGAYYRIAGASPAVQTVQRPRIPIYFGGASDAAVRVAGKHADVYALWAKPGRRRRSMGAPSGSACRSAPSWARLRMKPGRGPRTSWPAQCACGGEAALGPGQGLPANAGSQRLLAAAALGDRPEGQLHTAIVRATGAATPRRWSARRGRWRRRCSTTTRRA